MINTQESPVISEINELDNLLKESASDLEIIISKSAEILINAIKNNKTIFMCGNGGSASQSQHFVGELIGRFKKNRPGFKAISLSTDSSVITCIANDYGYENIFSRQLEALASDSDILVCLSTSGESKNIMKVLEKASKLNLFKIGFFGGKVKDAKNYTDLDLVINSKSTARIQEMHLFAIHCICGIIDQELGYG